MHIVSYRGALEAGGVSRLIQTGSRKDKFGTWWHMHNNHLQTRSGEQIKQVARISTKVVQGHYRYANEFLWPLMHERADLIRYDRASHEAFQAFNLAVALNLFGSVNRASGQIFTNDYQFALLPSYLNSRQNVQLSHFWHIPWPRICSPSTAEQLMEIARGLLSTQRLGFHTEQYVENFCNFVEEFLPEYRVRSGNTVLITSRKGGTELLVNPAGIDYHLWHHLASKTENPLPAYPYVLSVDRADYSKGVAERIDGIRRLFALRPDLRGKIQFVFICQQTRPGLEAFDNYWHLCRQKYRQLDLELSTSDWSPIRWIDTPCSTAELAAWYAHAAAMLINPSRDGLNLTAKEFVASTRNPQASLILSSGAGVWQELKEHVVSLRSNNADAIAQAVLDALQPDTGVRKIQHVQLRKIVRENSLDAWWIRMTAESEFVMPVIVPA